MHPSLAALESPHMRSGAFAFVFTPIALVLMGTAMSDVQTLTALGMPLASVEGLVGMALAAILLGLVSVNCAQSPVGMYVAFGWSMIIGFLQLIGVVQVPILMAASINFDDMTATVLWNLYPVIVSAILLGTAVAFHRIGAPARRGEGTRSSALRAHRRTWATVLVVLAILLADIILIEIAPADTTRIGAESMSGVVAAHSLQPAGGLLVALLLGAAASLSRRSLTGLQSVTWAVLILPSYLLLPLWTSLSGHVVTPGVSTMTRVSLAAPVATALGLTLVTATIGIYWARSLRSADPARDCEDQEAPGPDGPAAVTDPLAADPRPAGR
ncbi:hypothetical protein M3T53_01120 [Actinomyces sp. B33]|uniref:hypothetical protein n=1 Tax=Actinomyces sp. B33 TaxID=2942131 RepID=UPI002341AEE9|nr:hypothetical protein [Actinomyces sp. B33]MDC4232316.1 hypothetical protein [Actinomyces sp. B33]